MKREIKFRAKTANPNGIENHNSYWVYGLLENTGDKDYPHSIDGCFIKSETIGQFTGLKDKNGKEIYESDIISFNDYPDNLGVFGECGIVFFLSDECRYVVKLIETERIERLDYDTYAFAKKENFKEIIGNIHDNSGLLS